MKALKILGGVVVVALGIVAIFYWRWAVWTVVQAVIALGLLLGGALFVALSVTEPQG